MLTDPIELARLRRAYPVRCPELDASLFFHADEIRDAFLLAKQASTEDAHHAQSNHSPDRFNQQAPSELQRQRGGTPALNRECFIRARAENAQA
jgi:hypothetical protein